MQIKELIRILKTFAPPELAEEWDNTGLLIRPAPERDLRTVLLTVDLTEAVAREAVRRKADLIISYHPLFFKGLRRLDGTDPQARTALLLIQHGIGVYSPHTALDAAPGGVNDWLASLIGGEVSAAGSARVVKLKTAVSLTTLGALMKTRLKADTVQIAGTGRNVKTIALCAGSGADALRGTEADCWLTGEMKHHEVLAAVQNGICVLLCGHTETERGYLPVFADNLRTACGGGMNVHIARTDRPPLRSL